MWFRWYRCDIQILHNFLLFQIVENLLSYNVHQIISKCEVSEHFLLNLPSVRRGEEAVAAFTSSPSIGGGGASGSTEDGGGGGLNLSGGWHSCKYCQARFFFTAFGAPNSLQFQALNIPQWTSLQCLVSSIYNYIYFILPFWPLFLFGAFWYGLLDSFIIKEFTQEWLTTSGIKISNQIAAKKVWHTDTFQLVADVKVIVVILRKYPRIFSRIILRLTTSDVG